MATYTYSGTVQAAKDFDPKADAELLKKAMKGFGCDDKVVVNVLCHRSNVQRQQIKLVFKTMFGKDLEKELSSELAGHLESLMLALMVPPDEYDASQLRKAMKGKGTTESILTEIMCSRTPAMLRSIKAAFSRMYGRDLEKDLISETSGHFRRLLISLNTCARDETYTVDPAKAKSDAMALYDAGEGQWGTDESTFNSILAAQNFAQLNAVFAEYKGIAGREIEESIHREFSGDIRTSLLSICKCVRNRPAYFAERLYQSMKGLGTNDATLIRVVVSRSEIDMVQIKACFLILYKKTLSSFIEGDCSGNYKQALLTIVGP